ncbi:MAG: ATP-binding protein [Pseudomonadota bacterium]
MLREDWMLVPTPIGELEPVRSPDGEIEDFRWIAANPATVELVLGDRDDTLVGRTILGVMPFLKGQPIIDFMIEVFETGQGGQFVTSQGSRKDLFGMRFMARFAPLGHSLISTLEDVSSLIEAREAAVDKHHMFETACDHSVHGLILSDKDGNVHYANAAMCDMLGYSAEELHGLTSAEVVHPDDIGRNRDIVELLADGTLSQDVHEKRYIKADGSVLHVSVALTVVQKYRDGAALYINHVRDITQQREQVLRLKQALVQAEEAARLKSQFLANMSHEIRTPLNGIIGMAQILQHTELTDDQAENLAVLQESGHTLMALLNDILDLSKIEAGKLDVTPVKADLRHKLSRMFKLHEMAAAEKGVAFRSVIHPTVPSRLVFDPVRVRQCLDNLLANAVKFTSAGEIIIAITCGENVRGEHLVTVHVSDTGTGIPPEKQNQVFEAFQQVDGTVTRSHGGSGLGLAITRQLATLMGGGLSVKSEVGRGSVFTLTFKAGATVSPRLSPHAIRIEDPVSSPVPQLGQRRVLIVDDNSINRRVARILLSNYGIESDEATEGIEALDRLATQTYDLVLLDIHMPVLDGVRTFERLRQLPGGARDVPVIALTADAMSGDREKYLAMGMTGYVSKPIDERVLIAEIGRVLQTEISPLAKRA